MSQTAQITVPTQFGTLCVTATDTAIIRLEWGRAAQESTRAILRDAKAQLLAYDAGEVEGFDLPLAVAGSKTQQAVCAAISAIPFGYTRTYGDIARQLGIPAQVVGQACGGNLVPVIIPCHRVMGAKGLTGFSGAGGIETKVALLRHEGAAGLLI